VNIRGNPEVKDGYQESQKYNEPISIEAPP
jgi:hypothetical protein